MKKIKSLFIRFNLKKHLKQFFKGLYLFLMWLVIVLAWSLFIFSFIALLIVPYWLIIYPLIVVIIYLVNKYRDYMYLKEVRANTIIYGGRGSGKGLLFQKAINSEKKVFSNIPYGPNCEVISDKVYFNSISPNTSLHFLNDNISLVNKNEHYEGVPYYSDDSTTKFPNYLDSTLKKNYQSISLFLPLQRHFYNSYTVFNAQDINRIWIHVRELQLDGYIKALGVNGTGYIWNRLPVLRRFLRLRFRFYESLDSAVSGLLPFEKLGLVNKGVSPLYLTAGEATKEQYIASHGKIRQSVVYISKKNIHYDTRYYHKVFFGDVAPIKK